MSGGSATVAAPSSGGTTYDLSCGSLEKPQFPDHMYQHWGDDQRGYQRICDQIVRSGRPDPRGLPYSGDPGQSGDGFRYDRFRKKDDSDYVMVGCMDLGTANSGFALGRMNDKDKIIIPHQGKGANMKHATAILFDNDQKFVTYGEEAVEKYQQTGDGLFFSNFKMALYGPNRDGNLPETLLLTAANGKTMPAKPVFVAYVTAMKEDALRSIREGQESGVKILETEIRWVLCQPTIWKEPAKQFMRDVGLQAGLCTFENPNQLRMALESEVASIFCASERKKALVDAAKTVSARGSYGQVADSYQPKKKQEKIKHLVIDLGGGTADLTMHALKPGSDTLDDWQSSRGGPWGALMVNLGFENLLGDIVGVEFLKSYKLSHSTEWQRIDAEFETQKRRLKPSTNEMVWIGLPHDFHYDLEKTTGKTIQELCRAYSEKYLSRPVPVPVVEKENEKEKETKAIVAVTSPDSSVQDYLSSIFNTTNFFSPKAVDATTKDSKFMTDASGKNASTVPALAAATPATSATAAPIAATAAPIAATAAPTTTATPEKTVADTKTASEATDPVFWKRGRLRFHTDLLKALFTPVLDPLVAFLGETLQNQEVTCAYMVGGFAESEIVKSRVRTFLASCNCPLLVPQQPGVSVLTGGVMYGFDSTMLASRLVGCSYGFRTTETYVPSKHGITAQRVLVKRAEKEIYVVPTIWKSFCKINQRIYAQEYCEVHMFPSVDGQKELSIDIYKSTKGENQFVDEDSKAISLLGKLTIALPDINKAGIERKVIIQVHFGETEIKVKAMEYDTKKEYTTTLNYFPSAQVVATATIASK